MNLSTADELREIYRSPGAGAAGKSRSSIDEASARFIGRAPDLVEIVTCQFAIDDRESLRDDLEEDYAAELAAERVES